MNDPVATGVPIVPRGPSLETREGGWHATSPELGEPLDVPAPPVHPALRDPGRGDRAAGPGGGSTGGLAVGTAEPAARSGTSPARSVIFIFLSGGLAQHDSFDLKPEAPEGIRGEFRPIATPTPGVEICEHLPLLAEPEPALVAGPVADAPVERPFGRASHHADRPVGPADRLRPEPGPGRATGPRSRPWPGRSATRNNLPPAVVLPERLVHNTGRVIPGQFAGMMGPRRDPWFIEASPFDPTAYGAFPEYEFDHQERPRQGDAAEVRGRRA